MSKCFGHLQLQQILKKTEVQELKLINIMPKKSDKHLVENQCSKQFQLTETRTCQVVLLEQERHPVKEAGISITFIIFFLKKSKSSSEVCSL